MRKALSIVALAAMAASGAWAQMTPVGTWQSIDDKSGQPKAQIRIIESASGLSGRIEKTLRPDADPDATCTECTDDRKNQPVVGLEIIRGGSQDGDQARWEGGTILDPENGKQYRASLTPIDGGSKLQVRGHLGPFWRTQTWQRVP